MALTEYQKTICRLISESRKQQGVSYIAGGTSLNALTNSSRISHDIDIFNDTSEALLNGWENDRRLFEENQYDIEIIRERPTFIEAIVSKTDKKVILQWTCDSAFRFFPLVEHVDFGLTLHPIDLATNKCLALVGRLEARDWVDMITSHSKIQHLGLLSWAACGKDPGFSPPFILSEAAKVNHYSQTELETLIFENNVPTATELSLKWKKIIKEAQDIINVLPSAEAGQCVLDQTGELLKGSFSEIKNAILSRNILFHQGTISGAFPTIKG